MRTFHVALTGDFLDETGAPAYGDAGLALLSSCPFLRFRYLTEQAPRPGDRDYYQRFYSLEVTPEQVAGLHGLVVLRPWVKRATLERGYSITESAAGSIVRDAATLASGEEVKITFARGSARARVQGNNKVNG